MMTIASGRVFISPSQSAFHLARPPNVSPAPGLRGLDLAQTILGIAKEIEETQSAINRIDENVEEIKPWVPVLIGALVFVGVALILNKKK